MQSRQLGTLWPVSALTLGGGGVGQVFGQTNRQEAVATVHAAVDAGITLIDVAALYGQGEAERVIGEAFGGRMPDGVRITTKFKLGNPQPDEVEKAVLGSYEASLERMKLERVDLLFLHSPVVPDGYVLARSGPNREPAEVTTYRERVRPLLERLVREGRIGAWGMSAICLPETLIDVFGEDPRPGAVQCITNPLDSPGTLRWFDETPRPREIIAAAAANRIGVLGVRAVQAGALTDRIDRELPEDNLDMVDYRRAAPFRALAAETGEKPAILAHRYALSMAHVESVILGVKNRQELGECLAAEAAGPLDAGLRARIDAAVGQTAAERYAIDA